MIKRSNQLDKLIKEITEINDDLGWEAVEMAAEYCLDYDSPDSYDLFQYGVDMAVRAMELKTSIYEFTDDRYFSYFYFGPLKRILKELKAEKKRVKEETEDMAIELEWDEVGEVCSECGKER